jgi:GTPase SAR1 family protein
VGNDFEKQIEQELSGLPRKDICLFAWLCAVRALPFLGSDGHFGYWIQSNKDHRQTHLLAVLNALDFAPVRTDAYDDAYDVYDIYAATDAYDAANDAFAANAAAAANATRASAYADFASAYADSSSAAAAAASAAAASFKLNSTIMQDIASIKSGEYSFSNDMTIYGEAWPNFQRALRDIGCGYWADWYARLFQKGFIIDDDDMAEIKLRLRVPGEIAEQGAAAVARYVMDIKEKGAARLNEARVLVLGEKGSGKTSLSLRLKKPTHPMPKLKDSTEGVDVVDWQIPAVSGQLDSEVNVHIWDFAGHVITHAAHRCFMSERCLYILLINGRTEGENKTEYWLQQIRNYGGNSPILILVNVQDNHMVDIKENTLRKAFPSILGFYHVDIGKGGSDLEEFRQLVMNHLRENPIWKNQMMSAPAYRVKKELHRCFSDGKEYIPRDIFDRIANANDIPPEEHTQLLKDLHTLGICLWYDTEVMREFDMMVLNPNWISHGIYRLINWGMAKKQHILSTSDFKEIFTGENANRYPNEKAEFLFHLMNTYQLAFFMMNKQQVFVPFLLPADRANDEVLPEFPFGDRLRMEYRADRALPSYTVSRLAVLHSPELDQSLSWRFGALLSWNDTVALVEEDDLSRSVIVSVRGKKQTEYISRLRASLNRIFGDYKSSRPELKYEVILSDNLPTNVFIAHDLGHPIGGNDSINHFMQPESQIIGSAIAKQKIIAGVSLVEPQPTIVAYNMTINNQINIIGSRNVAIDGTLNDHSENTTINIEFNNCSIELQGDLRSLARGFRKSDVPEDINLAKELEETASDIEEVVKEIPPAAAPDSTEMNKINSSLRKKGLLNRLENLYDDLSDENSELRTKAEKFRRGVESLQTLGARYNDVAQWFGLPQVPRPFLGKQGPDA